MRAEDGRIRPVRLLHFAAAPLVLAREDREVVGPGWRRSGSMFVSMGLTWQLINGRWWLSSVVSRL
jgi:hypothetical protein